MTKVNFMKMPHGLLSEVFDAVRADHPDLATDHFTIDIGAARLAPCPERFDVAVTAHLHGDIRSDIATEVTGSVGLGASANIGEHVAMYEAIHGSAPDFAGQGMADPSGLLLSALIERGLDDIKTENLCTLDGEMGFAHGPGQ